MSDWKKKIKVLGGKNLKGGREKGKSYIKNVLKCLIITSFLAKNSNNFRPPPLCHKVEGDDRNEHFLPLIQLMNLHALDIIIYH